MKFGRIVLQLNAHRLTKSDYDMTSYFQDGGHDVCPPLSAAYSAASAGCPLACQARVTSLDHLFTAVTG